MNQEIPQDVVAQVANGDAPRLSRILEGLKGQPVRYGKGSSKAQKKRHLDATAFNAKHQVRCPFCGHWCEPIRGMAKSDNCPGCKSTYRVKGKDAPVVRFQR